jgi:hypothetical protein
MLLTGGFFYAFKNQLSTILSLPPRSQFQSIPPSMMTKFNAAAT